MFLQESEDGHAWDIAEILGVRAASEALVSPESDYLSVSAPPGVFAVLRGRDAIALASLSPHRVAGRVTLPGGRGFDIDLPPFGYEARRADGSPILPAGDAVRRSAPDAASSAPKVRTFTMDDGALAIAIDGAEAWFAHSADGSFASPFRTRHPGYGGKTGPIYRLRQGDNVLWDSRIHPFGLAKECAEAGGVAGGRAVSVTGFAPGADVRLLDRVGDAHGLCVVVYGDTNGVRVAHRDAASALAPRPLSSGDARVSAAFGGWLFETGNRRALVRRNGARIGEWTRGKDGAWNRTAGPSDGAVATEVRDGATLKFAQRHDAEAFARILRLDDGSVEMSFKGECRSEERLGKMRRPLAYRTVWRIGGDGSISERAEAPAHGKRKGNGR